MRGVAAHEDELAEPAVNEEGADDADHHDDQDDGPLVEDVREASTIHLVHAQEEPEVRRKTCMYVQRVWGETAAGTRLIVFSWRAIRFW